MNLTTDNIIDLLAIGATLLNIAVVTIVAILGYRLAFKNWLKQKKEETKIKERQQFTQSKLEAAKAAWALLGSCSDIPNERTFIDFELEGSDRKFFFQKDRGQAFVDDFNDFYFQKGHGLFLSKKIKAPFFKLRNHVREMVIRIQDTPTHNDRYPLEDETVLKEIRKKRAEIIKLLRAEIIEKD